MHFFSYSVRQKKEGSQQADDDEHVSVARVDIFDELDIDEEAALNTDANIRATRPSFSLAKENSSLLNMDSDSDPVPIGNRVPAIRFKGFVLMSNCLFLY